MSVYVYVRLLAIRPPTCGCSACYKKQFGKAILSVSNRYRLRIRTRVHTLSLLCTLLMSRASMHISSLTQNVVCYSCGVNVLFRTHFPSSEENVKWL